MLELQNVELADDYTPGASLGPIYTARTLDLQVLNNAATVRLSKLAREAGVREAVAMDELILKPGSYSFPGCIGLQAKNANPNYPARIYAYLFDRLDPEAIDHGPTGVIAGTDPTTGRPSLVPQPELLFGPTFSQQLGLSLPNPGDSSTTPPAPLAGYRSLAVSVVTNVAVDVTPTWEKADLTVGTGPPAIQTTATMSAGAGNTFLLFENQGDLLKEVEIACAAGGATVDYWIAGSNLDPCCLQEADVAACAIQFNKLNGLPTDCHGYLWAVSDDSIDFDYGQRGILYFDRTGDGADLGSQDPGNTKQGLIHTEPDDVTVQLSTFPTGGTLQARLLRATKTGYLEYQWNVELTKAGNTFIVNDHLGAPLVTFTG